MAGKRYYWLKLQDGFFDSKRIKKLRKIAGGDTYTIIYLKMQLLAMKRDGVLEYSGLEDSFAAELALDLNEEPDNVSVTVSYLLSCGLLETADNREYFVPYSVENTGSEGTSAKRMRQLRERHASQSDGEIEIEIEIDKENTPLPPKGAEKFDRFWTAYPKKVGKEAARKAMAKVKAPIETILTAIEQQKRSEQWTKDNGQFIPNPATWLNQGRWEDELPQNPRERGEYDDAI
jgi:predicted phage replisome organizer